MRNIKLRGVGPHQGHNIQYDRLRRVGVTEREATVKLQKMKDAIARADDLEVELADVGKQLSDVESGMAAGDAYSWALDMIRRFRGTHRVDVPGISQPVLAEMNLLPKFPYRQASFTLSGTGFYHDIGKFISDFENQFPEIRVVNLSLSPITGLVAEDREKLEFKMDIVALMRPNPS